VPKACSGQYSHAWGVFYGGIAPVWSNRTLSAILGRHLGRAETVAYVDLHTGLGPYGYGEAICYHPPGSPEYELAARWYGPSLTSPHAGTASAPVNLGKTGYGVAQALPQAKVVSITLEFGTWAPAEVLSAIRADAWLHAYGELESELGRSIKSAIRRAFYPDLDDWRERVLARSRQVFAQGLAGLGG
jgi:hypothetical protein